VLQAIVSIATEISTTTGDPKTSGLIGLGYPALTSGFNETTGEPIPYYPIVTRMWNAGLIEENSFSLALSADGGQLAFGTLPPGVEYQTPWASAAINPDIIDGTAIYTRYQIDAAWSYAGTDEDDITSNLLMDSGSTLNYVPTDVANAVNALFQPPVNDDGSVDCNAIAPAFGPVIGGCEFLINQEDMFFQNSDGSCSSAILASDDFFLMGDAFLRSVLVVYDLANQTMQFAKRV
jgi:hypothetical protein